MNEERERRKNSKDTRVHSVAMVLWLNLTARIAALGTADFERGPVVIKKIHAYLLKVINLAGRVGSRMDRVLPGESLPIAFSIPD